MDAAQFERLVARAEGPTIDFKATDYLLGNEALNGAFLKDMLAFLNTPRDEDAHVVLGVKRHADGRTEFPGITALKDDNDYQQVLKCVDPTPVIDFDTVERDGKRFGIVRISRSRRGPFCSTKDVGSVKKGVLYWRQVSMNTEAASMEDQKAIHRWAAEPEAAAAPLTAGISDDWQRLTERTQGFATGAQYVLVCWGVASAERGRLSQVGHAPWLAVFDFDVASAQGGLSSEMMGPLKEHRVVHEVIIGDRPTVHTNNATYWYYARGVDGRANSLVAGGLRNWRARYPRDIRVFLDALSAGTDLAPIHVISVFPAGGELEGAPYVDALLGLFTEAFGDRVAFHLCAGDQAAIAPIAQQHEGEVYALRPSDVARGIAARYSVGLTSGAQGPTLPSRGGVAYPLTVNDRLWLEEELDAVYLSAGVDGAAAHAADFLNGGSPSWANLSIHDDADRDLTPRILKQIRQDLGLTHTHSSGTVRINIYHEPGAGGSTLARRLLWELHREVPCVVIHRCMPHETTERLRLLYNACALPVLALAEGSEITDTAAEDLYSHLKSQQVPVVLLRVLRSFTAPTTSAGRDGSVRAFYLPPDVSKNEAVGFGEKFSRAMPIRRPQIQRVAAAGDGGRHPFYFGLVAFDKEFLGLGGYVEARLRGATLPQKEMLIYLSLAYCYGQKGLAGQAFGTLLGIPATHLVDLARGFSLEQRQLLRVEGGYWRPVHQMVGEEVLRQLLDPQRAERDVWKQNLSHWAAKFAEFCRGRHEVVGAEMMDVVSRCFLLRDARDVIGREDARAFSRLIEDVPSLEAQAALLEQLTCLFPDEPHVWAHAGRFEFQRKRDPRRAREFIDRAIELAPDDHVLYHIKGMAFRSECYDLIDGIRRAGKVGDVAELERLVLHASEQFGEARSRAPDDEHGYISQVQLLIKVVDALRTINGGRTVETLSGLPNVGALVRRAVDEAGSLLEQVRANREGERISEYTVRCTAQLDELYGNYQAVLQAWDSLLARNDVYKPPVRRQLVRAYLSRHDRRWNALSQKEIVRSVELLQGNLLEEPGEEQNLRLWVQAVRRLEPTPPVGRLVERVAYWRSNSDSVDAAYYFYVLHAIEALSGSPLSRQALDEAVTECKRRARSRKNRNWSFEWLGPGKGAVQLVHHTELGAWDDASDFWSGRDLLARVRGRVSKIAGPEAGFIELSHGITAFFVPGRAGVSANRDENRLVEFFLGFTYDGLRAWEVRLVEGA